jgi:vacuolar iron transporter family protein
MPQTLHVERHFTGSETVKDIVIGMADGLTVPFALAAGLSGAIETTRIIVTAGLAEIAAGSIAMGLGGYMAAKSDAEHYDSERVREESEVNEKADIEASIDVQNRAGQLPDRVWNWIRTQPEPIAKTAAGFVTQDRV